MLNGISSRKKICIITSGYFPIPPVKGGAIENLVQLLVEENEIEDKTELTIVSIYDREAQVIAKQYKKTHFVYVKVPSVIIEFDRLIYWSAKNILQVKKSMSYRYISQRLYFIYACQRYIKDYDFDEVVVENHPTLLSVFKDSNLRKYKGHIYYHAHNEILRAFGNEKYIQNVDNYICVSNYIKSTIMSFTGIQDNSRFSILKNRIDQSKFLSISEESVIKFKNSHNIPGECTIYLFSGRLNPEKGVLELIKAYKKASLPRARLMIAGSYYFGSGMKSSYESQLAEEAEDIKDQIIFTGNVDYSDMPLLYAASDIVVAPSVWNEPAFLTGIEAITAGKPLITTNKGGIPEYANESNALIVNVDDNFIDNLSDALKKLYEDRKLRESLQKSAIETSKDWTRRSYYEDFIKIMEGTR